ncbi:hypothetical protein HPB48_002429 [Haemaphysalis longicornis]|uniref:Uncharacterized protein n=1 Tax=Haemaphysalis longicornis TaxID=44386 RepID=A0A9J6GV87_HAELO|nr:hypothetical protein HPB48_002429 [Haemaphysalis longicornis]
MVTSVDGEVITTEQYEESSGWLQCHRLTHGRDLHHLQQNTTRPANSTLAKNNTTAQTTTQRFHPTKLPRRRCPKLPMDDIKVVVRPRDGFNVTRVSEAPPRGSILLAAGLEPETVIEDLWGLITSRTTSWGAPRSLPEPSDMRAWKNSR